MHEKKYNTNRNLLNSNGHSTTPDCSADAISPCAFHCLRAVSIMMTSYTDKLLLLFISHIVMPGCFQIDDKVIVFHGSRRGSQGTVVSTGTESWRGWRSGRKISNDSRILLEYIAPTTNVCCQQQSNRRTTTTNKTNKRFLTI